MVDKAIYSLFNDEGARAIEEGGWRDLIFCGVATESCVLKSATDASERDLHEDRCHDDAANPGTTSLSAATAGR